VEFEWDERKREANLAKHGLDFADAELVFTEDALVLPAVRHSEPRHVLMGPLRGRLVLVAFTWRAGRVRVISMRRASAQEQKRYAEKRLEAT
jgi:uncharacterized protein